MKTFQGIFIMVKKTQDPLTHQQDNKNILD